MRRRLIRGKGFVILLFAVIFSFGVLGQVDTRMHIGGSDWDVDVVYINVDEYVYSTLVSQYDFGQPSSSVQTLAALDGAAQEVENKTTKDAGTVASLP